MTAVAGLVGSLLGLIATATLVGTPVFSFADEGIDESSGLVDLGETMVTTNDSGDDAVLYLVDEAGRTIGRTTYADEVQDVEALAPAGGREVWAADIGDNRERRTSVQVYRVPVTAGDRTVRAPRYELVYPDGPHDAESLLAGPDGRLRIVSKGVLGGSVYVAPKVLDPDGPNRLTRGPSIGLYATDAAVLPGGRHALVRGYGTALVATFPEFEPVAFVTLPAQEQGEGVSIGRNGRIRLSTEGANSEVLQISLPADVREQVRATTTGPPPNVPEPVDQAGEDQGGPADRWLFGGTVAVVLLLVLAVRRRR